MVGHCFDNLDVFIILFFLFYMSWVEPVSFLVCSSFLWFSVMCMLFYDRIAENNQIKLQTIIGIRTTSVIYYETQHNKEFKSLF